MCCRPAWFSVPCLVNVRPHHYAATCAKKPPKKQADVQERDGAAFWMMTNRVPVNAAAAVTCCECECAICLAAAELLSEQQRSPTVIWFFLGFFPQETDGLKAKWHLELKLHFCRIRKENNHSCDRRCHFSDRSWACSISEDVPVSCPCLNHAA